MTDNNLAVAGQAASELLPAVQEFARATGLTAPLHELTSWISDEIRYRRIERKADLLLRAARTLRESELPSRAVEDRWLRAVLEDGALEEDEAMRKRWANLLANACVAGEHGRRPHVAFPRILSEVESLEAQMLDAMYSALEAEGQGEPVIDQKGRRDHTKRSTDGFDVRFFMRRGVSQGRHTYASAASNLLRLQLVAERSGAAPTDRVWEAHRMRGDDSLSFPVQLTYFGALFVQACQPPRGAQLPAAFRGVPRRSSDG